MKGWDEGAGMRQLMRRRDERGQVSLLIIGFATVLLLAIAVVLDASAAYLHRQGLSTLADGAALQGADLGATGVYAEGLPDERLALDDTSVRAAVKAYLDQVGADRRFPGVKHAVRVDADAGLVRVTLRASVDLPLRVPWLEKPPSVTAVGSAAVTVQR